MSSGSRARQAPRRKRVDVEKRRSDSRRRPAPRRQRSRSRGIERSRSRGTRSRPYQARERPRSDSRERQARPRESTRRKRSRSHRFFSFRSRRRSPFDWRPRGFTRGRSRSCGTNLRAQRAPKRRGESRSHSPSLRPSGPRQPGHPPPASAYAMKGEQAKGQQGKGKRGKKQGKGTRGNPQSRSAETRSAEAPTLNFIVAQFVVTPDVCAEDLTWLLSETPAHIVIMLLDAVASDDNKQKLVQMAADALRECDKFEALWSPAGAVLSRKGRVEKADLLTSAHGGGCHCEIYRFKTIPCHMSSAAAVAVGVMYSDGGRFAQSFVDRAAAMIRKKRVRFVACAFGSHLQEGGVGELRMVGQGHGPPTPFFQPWRKPSEQREPNRSCGSSSSAFASQAKVAERWELEAEDVGNYMVHPACLLFFGRAQDISEV